MTCLKPRVQSSWLGAGVLLGCRQDPVPIPGRGCPLGEGQRALLELPFLPPTFLPDYDFSSWPCSPEKRLHAEGLWFVPAYLSSEVRGGFLIKMLNILGSGTRCRRRITFSIQIKACHSTGPNCRLREELPTRVMQKRKVLGDYFCLPFAKKQRNANSRRQ